MTLNEFVDDLKYYNNEQILEQIKYNYEYKQSRLNDLIEYIKDFQEQKNKEYEEVIEKLESKKLEELDKMYLIKINYSFFNEVNEIMKEVKKEKNFLDKHYTNYSIK